jgi:hypothetical protein
MGRGIPLRSFQVTLRDVSTPLDMTEKLARQEKFVVGRPFLAAFYQSDGGDDRRPTNQQ